MSKDYILSVSLVFMAGMIGGVFLGEYKGSHRVPIYEHPAVMVNKGILSTSAKSINFVPGPGCLVVGTVMRDGLVVIQIARDESFHPK